LLPTQVRIELSAVDGDPSGAIRAALSAATLAQLLDLTVLPTSAPFPLSAVPTSGSAALSLATLAQLVPPYRHDDNGYKRA
jgi:hypothetical protein